LHHHKLIEQLLLEAGLISASQIQLAKQEEKSHGMELSEIFVVRGWVKQVTVDFFAQRWSAMLAERSRKPLPYYFKESGLLEISQINEILKIQKKSVEKMRFHRIAVDQGYLQQTTVDFFLAHMFNVYDPKTTVSIPPHELVRSYAKGEKDFSNTDLRSASLKGVSLIGVTLNGSNLRQANFIKANLNRSSLIRVNLNQANLTQAILTETNFSRSFLKQANLESAHLEQANFSSAVLESANLQSAYLAKADFSGADLRGAKLSLNYPYEVYYDRSTVFDSDFTPTLAGWKIKQH